MGQVLPSNRFGPMQIGQPAWQFTATTLRLGPRHRQCLFAIDDKVRKHKECDSMAAEAFTRADLNDGFVVAIEIVAKAGEEDAVAGALAALIAPTMAEPGVKLFLPYRSPTDPAAFFIFELYQNEAGWAEHQKTGHFKAFVETMLPRIARRQRVPYVPYVPNA
jgi:quinol monooxygenase YgiN